MLDWDDLRFFLAVARYKTLATASKHHAIDGRPADRLLAGEHGRSTV